MSVQHLPDLPQRHASRSPPASSSGQPGNHVPPIPSTHRLRRVPRQQPERGDLDRARRQHSDAALRVDRQQLPAVPRGADLRRRARALHADVDPGVSPTKKTPLAPPHIPILAGTDCSACHGAAYQAGGFGPATAMSAAKHAFVLERPATPATTPARASTWAAARRCSCAPPITSRAPIRAWPPAIARCATRPTDWASSVLPAGHMPNPGEPSPARLPRLGTRRLHAGDAAPPSRRCTPASAATAACATATPPRR